MKFYSLFILCCIVIVSKTFAQDTSRVKSEKLPSETKIFGPYVVTMDNGKITVAKNPNYDSTKTLKRHSASRFPLGAVEIYSSDSAKPIIKKYFIYNMTSISSDSLMPKEVRLAKYHSRAGVLVVHLNPRVIPVSEIDLLNKFNVSQKNYNLPLYVDYEPIAKPDDLLAIPDAVLKIETVTDRDGFIFLNITTKEWDAEMKKYAGKDIIWIR